MSEIQEIPLREFHAKHGARFVNFGGWNMPVQYTSILEEHQAVRKAAGLFDVSHMGEFFVRGTDAGAYLDRLVVNRIAKAPVGKAIYSPMCTEDGNVVDDLIVYCISATEFLICVNAGNIEKDLAWFRDKAAAWQLELTVEDQSEQFALLALQGPVAEEILVAAGLDAAAELQRFYHQSLAWDNAELRICRTGYTGEDGFEIYVHPNDAEKLAQRIMEAGAEKGLKLCGLGARDSLRLEAGLPLYGHEISNEISPLEAGLGWTVKFKKPDFVGKAALAQQKESGLKQRVIHFKLEGRRIAREGTDVVSENGERVGRVLSGTLSPMTSTPIGSALVATEALDAALYVDLRGNKQTLLTAKPPLHK
ncbi:glycine cleavage system aminomethyltransferase GcvT [Coraliomargarita sinensis]|uniref:Aminomethyltransferase n=1 Tax=Coraliomargarita sinensis TaxID=2174842 RepID=A0A317ZMV0_9BACT|nr:glycine cleavage system aminomethyltransferase GcvT [Coraliomargarita sinensis]PXA05573.1 glycine cleavage system aminomethyltransferase GcvT [Coraliomargarita sinensis]